MTNDPIVLLVDDCKTDALLMRVVFERGGLRQPLQFANDGDDAIAYLQGDGSYGNREQYPLPTLVLMDLNMPRRNGFETLKWIRQQPAFKRLQVYILSGSNRSDDIRLAYELGANSYLVKPSNLADLVLMARSLVAWLKFVHVAPAPALNDGRESVSASGARVEEPGYVRTQGR